MDFLSFPFIKIPVVAVIVSADVAWQYNVLFGFQPIIVLSLHIQIHAHAVLGCTYHPEQYIRVSVFAFTFQSSFHL